MASAIYRELRVARGLCSCLSDESALDEADRELRDVIHALRCAEITIRTYCPPVDGLADHPTLTMVSDLLARLQAVTP